MVLEVQLTQGHSDKELETPSILGKIPEYLEYLAYYRMKERY